MAALSGAMLIALAAREWMGVDAILPITLAGILASLIDGIISSCFPRGKLAHHLGNILACICGAGLAVLLHVLFESGGST
jgi:uncharacterized membrane protein